MSSGIYHLRAHAARARRTTDIMRRSAHHIAEEEQRYREHIHALPRCRARAVTNDEQDTGTDIFLLPELLPLVSSPSIHHVIMREFWQRGTRQRVMAARAVVVSNIMNASRRDAPRARARRARCCYRPSYQYRANQSSSDQTSSSRHIRRQAIYR